MTARELSVPECYDEFFSLLARIPPFPYEHVEQVFREEFGRLDELFDRFEREPMAGDVGSAPVAAVGRFAGELGDGERTPPPERCGPARYCAGSRIGEMMARIEVTGGGDRDGVVRRRALRHPRMAAGSPSMN